MGTQIGSQPYILKLQVWACCHFHRCCPQDGEADCWHVGMLVDTWHSHVQKICRIASECVFARKSQLTFSTCI